MRTFLIVLTILLPSLLFADDFSEFRIPAHRVYNITGELGCHFDTYRRNDNSEYYRDTQFESDASANGYGLWDADDRMLQATFRSQLSGRWGATRRENLSGYFNGSTQTSVSSSASYDQQLAATLRARFYPGSGPVGIEPAAAADMAFRQQHRLSRLTRDVSDDASYYAPDQQDSRTRGDDADYSATGTVTLGIGRVRDVSAVFDLLILERRLLQRGLIDQSLAPATRRRLAALLYTETDFDRIHERSRKYFWQAVLDILRDDPHLKSRDLDAFDLYLLSEPHIGAVANSVRLPAPIFPVAQSGASRVPLRLRGWFAGPLLEVAHSHSIEREAQHFFSHYHTPDSTFTRDGNHYQHSDQSWDFVYAGVRAEYHRPLGVRWQLDLDGKARWQLGRIVNVDREVTAGAQIRYWIADRWQADAGMFTSWQRASYNYPYSAQVSAKWESVDVIAHATILYYLEDNLAIEFSGHYSQTADWDYSYATTRRTDDGSFTLGLTYRLASGLSLQ